MVQISLLSKHQIIYLSCCSQAADAVIPSSDRSGRIRRISRIPKTWEHLKDWKYLLSQWLISMESQLLNYLGQGRFTRSSIINTSIWIQIEQSMSCLRIFWQPQSRVITRPLSRPSITLQGDIRATIKKLTPSGLGGQDQPSLGPSMAILGSPLAVILTIASGGDTITETASPQLLRTVKFK